MLVVVSVMLGVLVSVVHVVNVVAVLDGVVSAVLGVTVVFDGVLGVLFFGHDVSPFRVGGQWV
ncbi:hypothetical protein ADILRU_2654 [Leifsonia rubra CMS 76R]|nr:hypothetical protein ADILRU_2654 [Leifsonia rubra CMS 76R]